jgi:hypothetical protein
MPATVSGHPGVSSAALVIVCALVVHFTALGNGFHYDDGHSILRNPHIHDLGNLGEFFTDPTMYSQNPGYAMYRPFVVVSTALNYRVSSLLSGDAEDGYDPAGYLLLNLIIHLANSLLVLAIFSQLTLPQSIRSIGSIAFSLHPLHTEVINYASARSESLVALFYLGTVYGYLRWRCPGADRRALWLGVSSVLFACALLTKEIAVTLPIALFAVECYTQRSWSGSNTSLQLTSLVSGIKKLTIYFVILFVYFVVYQHVTGSDSISPIRTDGAVRSWGSQLGTQAKAIVYYILGAVFPTRMSVYPQFQESPSFLGLISLVSGLMTASLCVVAWRLRTTVPAVTLGVCWFLIALIPTSVIPLHILVNDHRPYLSLFGFTLAVWALAARFRHRWILWAVCGLLALLAHQQDSVWSNELTLWQDATQKGPLVPEAHFNLGHAHHMAGDLPGAMVAYERAVHLSPRYTRAQINLGAIYREQGRTEEAKEAFEHALASTPTSVEALNNLGLTHASQGSFDVAIGLYQQALELEPDKAELWLNLGLSLRDFGRKKAAIKALRRALELDPQIKHRFPAR